MFAINRGVKLNNFETCLLSVVFTINKVHEFIIQPSYLVCMHALLPYRAQQVNTSQGRQWNIPGMYVIFLLLLLFCLLAFCSSYQPCTHVCGSKRQMLNFVRKLGRKFGNVQVLWSCIIQTSASTCWFTLGCATFKWSIIRALLW